MSGGLGTLSQRQQLQRLIQGNPSSEGKKTSNNFQYEIYIVKVIEYGREEVIVSLKFVQS